MRDTLQESPQPQIRYRSPSSVDLEGQQPPSTAFPADLEAAARMRKPRQQESFSGKICRNKGVVLVISVPILLFSFVFYVMPHGNELRYLAGGRKIGSDGDGDGKSYAVIFDAGSSGSRVHVYCFDRNLDLLPIGKDLELFVQKKPGLSHYAENPRKAAESLSDLLEQAEHVVPSGLRRKTPVRVGATAGLRQLGIEASNKILREVVDFLQDKSSLKSKQDWVTVLDGNQEGAFQWVTINYLLGNLGKSYSSTVGVVDLGGGSVQMAYAISKEEAENAPKTFNGKESYVKDLFLKETDYHLYVHSYLHYGLLAARAEILKIDNAANFCILEGYHGKYKYSGNEYDASGSSGHSFTRCREAAVKALKGNEVACTHMKCTFGGVWNGGGGDGQKSLFVASFFFDRAVEAGLVDRNASVVKVKPSYIEDAAKKSCECNLDDARSKYPYVEESNLPYLCMDLVYQLTLLVDGFELDLNQDITLVKKLKYGDSYVEAAWPLGSAIEVASSA